MEWVDAGEASGLGDDGEDFGGCGEDCVCAGSGV